MSPASTPTHKPHLKERKLCPIRQIACATSGGDTAPYCVEGRCAWWDAPEEQCVLVSLSNCVEYLATLPDEARRTRNEICRRLEER